MSQPHITAVMVGRGGQVVQKRVVSAEMSSERSTMFGNRGKRSIKDRLGDQRSDHPGSVQSSSSKRPRYEQSGLRYSQHTSEDCQMRTEVANASYGSPDLRVKLLQKSALRAAQAADHGSAASRKDFREKRVVPVPIPQVELRREVARVPVLRNTSMIAAPAMTRVPGAYSNPTPKISNVEEQTIGALLQSLGLSKYLISFQVEEVDMAALRHMGDEDLKQLGLPMGPRKKILLALSGRR